MRQDSGNHNDVGAIAEYLKRTCDPAIDYIRTPDDHDAVHRPAHYRRGGFELIDVIEAWGLDWDGYIMQAVQYLFRAGLKGSSKLEDYRKAQVYLERRIRSLERAEKEAARQRQA